MGRPLDKQYFGQPTGAFDKLTVDMWDGATVTTSYIVEQVATGEFIVTDGAVEDRVELQAAPVTAAGQGRIAVSVFGGGTEYARNVLSHLVKTFQGGNYPWSLEAADDAREADLPLA